VGWCATDFVRIPKKPDQKLFSRPVAKRVELLWLFESFHRSYSPHPV
jgi:hypothetical protein